MPSATASSKLVFEVEVISEILATDMAFSSFCGHLPISYTGRHASCVHCAVRDGSRT
jgi:hypothetical protein